MVNHSYTLKWRLLCHELLSVWRFVPCCCPFLVKNFNICVHWRDFTIVLFLVRSFSVLRFRIDITLQNTFGRTPSISVSLKIWKTLSWAPSLWLDPLGLHHANRHLYSSTFDSSTHWLKQFVYFVYPYIDFNLYYVNFSSLLFFFSCFSLGFVFFFF